MKPKICIVGTHHAYQSEIVRESYSKTLVELITNHNVDLVEEEATGVPTTFAKMFIENIYPPKVNSDARWTNVDLTREERKNVPDVNPYSIGPRVDFDLHMLREWVWVIRTSKAIKHSALLICGWCHTFSVAEKFQWAGFDVEINVYFDKADENRIVSVRDDAI